jgi:hypothetical protein
VCIPQTELAGTTATERAEDQAWFASGSPVNWLGLAGVAVFVAGLCHPAFLAPEAEDERDKPRDRLAVR